MQASPTTQQQSAQHYKILNGDVLEQLRTLPSNFFDAVLSDPPYGLFFMSRAWDKGVPSAEVYAELGRTLKPGAFGLHFGGTRTFHRLAVNLEDSGFEIRDCLAWVFGSGFPKSHNISKALDKAAGAEREVIGRNPNSRENGNKDTNLYELGTVGKTAHFTMPTTDAAQLWDGYGTALKPAFEPCLLVQKPLDGTFANNALTHGCGGLNIEGCRVGTDDNLNGGTYSNGEWTTNIGQEYIGGHKRVPGGYQQPAGRFPANLLLDEEAAAALDASVGMKEGPSRFFYSAKVSTAERNAGCELLPAAQTTFAAGTGLQANGDGSPRNKEATARNAHPTLKPIALTTYLAKLLLVPPRADGQPRRILVPFSGAGSEMIGCLLAGWDEVWGIELDKGYIDVAKARIAHNTSATPLEG